MEPVRLLALVPIALSLVAATCNPDVSEPKVSYGFEGVVTQVHDGSGQLQNQLSPGITVTGKIEHIQNPASQNPGNYPFAPGDGDLWVLGGGISVNHTSSLRIIVWNDAQPGDRWMARQQGPISDLTVSSADLAGQGYDQVVSSVTLTDASGTAFSSVALPTSLTLGDFDKARFRIDILDGNTIPAYVVGTVTKLWTN